VSMELTCPSARYIRWSLEGTTAVPYVAYRGSPSMVCIRGEVPSKPSILKNLSHTEGHTGPLWASYSLALDVPE
jgi:hypothetical protein